MTVVHPIQAFLETVLDDWFGHEEQFPSEDGTAVLGFESGPSIVKDRPHRLLG
jgi:hypothetical protein